MNDSEPEDVAALLAQAAITNCLHRYTRGIDRLDAELIRSVFHADATDCRSGFVRSREEFVDWYVGSQGPGREVTQHFLTNIMIDLDGDAAHAESCWIACIKQRDRTDLDMLGGRYLDRLSRREGRWAIDLRVCATQWFVTLDAEKMPAFLARGGGLSTRDHSDPSYERPLRLPRGLTAEGSTDR
jgi:SnoaL-like domain